MRQWREKYWWLFLSCEDTGHWVKDSPEKQETEADWTNLMVFWHGPWSFFHLADVQWDSMCRPACHFHFGLLEVVFHQEWCMFLVAVMLEDKATIKTWLCCSLLFSQNLFILHDSFCLDKISSFWSTEASPQYKSSFSVFNCGDCVLWAVVFLFLSPNSVSNTKVL